LKKVTVKQVDAFTKVPFSGNPAGVVSAASGLTVKQMKLIAREMNLSETAFISPPKTPSAHMNIRWFTPTHEVDLCGHATIAGFHVLAEEKRYGMTGSGKYAFNVETRSGVLPINVTIRKGGEILIGCGMPIPDFENFLLDEKELVEALGINSDRFDFQYPLSKDKFQIVVPVKKLKDLHSLELNFSKIRKICKENGALALTVFTTDTTEKSSAIQTRCFAPLVGVNEDPVTGSSLGPIGVYLAENDIVKSGGGKIKYVAEQGDCLDRPGRVTVELKKSREGFHSLVIYGNAVTVLEGEMHLK